VRFKIAGIKFGHVPCTGLSPAEARAKAQRNAGEGSTSPIATRPVEGGHGRGAGGLPIGRAPPRPTDDAARRAQTPLPAQRPPLPDDRMGYMQGPLRPAEKWPMSHPWHQISSPLNRAQPIEPLPPSRLPVGPGAPQVDSLDGATRFQYGYFNLKPTPATLPKFTNADLIGTPAVLGAGAFNQVYSVKLRGPGGAPIDAVFKPLNAKETGWVAGHTGIPRHDPQTAVRNLSTVDYAKALGFDVVAETCVARITLPDAELPLPRLGLVMERAQGQTARQMTPSLVGREAIMREVTKLQLLDHLVAQGDRHGNNYFVDVQADGKVRVTGIDNDQCFGDKVTHPEGIRFGREEEREGFRGTRLPPVVDTEMAMAINSLTPAKVQEMLSDKLSESEVDAAVQRLHGVQRHIAELEQRGRVIDPNTWNEPALHELMRPDNSYFIRDQVVAAYGQSKARGNEARARW
jgi:hypothetical protein